MYVCYVYLNTWQVYVLYVCVYICMYMHMYLWCMCLCCMYVGVCIICVWWYSLLELFKWRYGCVNIVYYHVYCRRLDIDRLQPSSFWSSLIMSNSPVIYELCYCLQPWAVISYNRSLPPQPREQRLPSTWITTSSGLALSLLPHTHPALSLTWLNANCI